MSRVDLKKLPSSRIGQLKEKQSADLQYPRRKYIKNLRFKTIFFPTESFKSLPEKFI